MEKNEPCQISLVEACIVAETRAPSFLTCSKIPEAIRKPRSCAENAIVSLRCMHDQEALETLDCNTITAETCELQRLLSMGIVTCVSKAAISLSLQIYVRLNGLEQEYEESLLNIAVLDISDKFISPAPKEVCIKRKIARLLLNKAKSRQALTDKEKVFLEAQRRVFPAQNNGLLQTAMSEFDAFNESLWTLEEELLLRLDYKMTYISPSDFLELFAEVSQLSEKSFNMALNLCYAVESQVASQTYLPSHIAAACASLLYYEDNKIRWNNSLQFWSGYELNDIENAIEFVDRLWQRQKIHMISHQ